jgi:hypothetical protein
VFRASRELNEVHGCGSITLKDAMSVGTGAIHADDKQRCVGASLCCGN